MDGLQAAIEIVMFVSHKINDTAAVIFENILYVSFLIHSFKAFEVGRRNWIGSHDLGNCFQN